MRKTQTQTEAIFYHEDYTLEPVIKSHWKQHFFVAGKTFDANIVKKIWKTQMATEKNPKR